MWGYRLGCQIGTLFVHHRGRHLEHHFEYHWRPDEESVGWEIEQGGGCGLYDPS
jgi:hypothetical protein